jgi:hypothetical protein
VTQVLDKKPDLNKVRECIDFLDEISTKWHNKDIFPTIFLRLMTNGLGTFTPMAGLLLVRLHLVK